MLEIGESVASLPEVAAGRSLKRIHTRESTLTGYSDRPDVRVMYDSLPSLPRRNSGWHTGWIRTGQIGRDLRRFFAPFRGTGNWTIDIYGEKNGDNN